ncbi:MAG TPA: histidine phosphatase family protein [Chitinophagales bacterium]|nr:histidine phosphatase family protein [Chitinophagales bacterium]
MKYLTIIRHAKSSWSTPDLDDILRPLNERGLKSIKIIGNYLKKKNIQPDLIITSPATRAVQTAVGIGDLVNYKIDSLKINQEIYFGNTTDILAIIKNIDATVNDIFLFGHEPILSLLIYHFTKTSLEKFPTCAVYRIAFDIKSWKETDLKIGKCEFYVNPKLLIEK